MNIVEAATHYADYLIEHAVTVESWSTLSIPMMITCPVVAKEEEVQCQDFGGSCSDPEARASYSYTGPTADLSRAFDNYIFTKYGFSGGRKVDCFSVSSGDP